MRQDRIVVIEDDEDIQELIRYNLGKEGYQVTCFIRGEDGLREIRDKAPDNWYIGCKEAAERGLIAGVI